MKLYIYQYCDGWNIDRVIVAAYSVLESVFEIVKYTDSEDYELQGIIPVNCLKQGVIL
jgi:hypothetical protein